MKCPNCGKELPDEARFCTGCGEQLVFDRLDVTTAAPVASPAFDEASSEAKPVSRKGRIPIVIAVCVALVAAGIGGYLWWQADQQQKAAAEADRIAHTDHAVTVAVSVPGFDDASSSKIPLKVTGSDLDGTAVDQVFYVDGEGRGITLRQGTYDVSAAGSPLLADGTIFAVPDSSYSAVVGSDAGDGTAMDFSSQATFTFTPSDALSVSDDQITSAYELAKAGGATSADAAQQLRDAATKRRDDAVAAKKAADEAAAQKAAEEAAAAEKAKWHVSTSRYEFDLPEYWHNKVRVQIAEGGSEYENTKATIYSTKYPDQIVCRLYIDDNTFGGEPAGDPSAYQVEVANYSSDSALCVGFRGYLWIAMHGSSASSRLPDDEVLYLEDLQAQGAEDYDAMSKALAGSNSKTSGEIEGSALTQFDNTVTPTIVLK